MSDRFANCRRFYPALEFCREQRSHAYALANVAYDLEQYAFANALLDVVDAFGDVQRELHPLCRVHGEEVSALEVTACFGGILGCINRLRETVETRELPEEEHDILESFWTYDLMQLAEYVIRQI